MIPGYCSTISRLLAGLVCAAVIAPVFADEIYRWVDAEGRVQFGDKPPPEGAERLEPAPAPAGDPQLQQQRERGERLLDVMTEDRERRDDEQRAEQQAEAQRRSKCERARKTAAQAADVNFIYEPTGDPANPRILDEAERRDYEQQLQAEVRRHCGKADAPK